MNIQTHYSILQCLTSPDKVVKACKAAGYSQLILCDRNSMSGVVEFYEACLAEGVKPILGVCLKVCEMDSTIKDEYNLMYDICLVAKNQQGYKHLLKIISLANDPNRVLETKYQKLARFHLDDVKGLTDGVVCVLASGSEWEHHSGDYTRQKYEAVFEEVLTSDDIYWADVRYLSKEQEEDWEVQQCVLLKCLLSELPQKGKELNIPLKRDNSLPLFSSYQASHLYERTQSFLNACVQYEILCKPKVPKFDCPDGMSQQEYLTELCRLGWRRRFPKWESEEKKREYAERVKFELNVLQSCELDGYFLVVQDYINWAKRQGWFVGIGRGSVGGSLVAYLLGITEIDPIKHNLSFDRFYSADRSAGGTVSLPDVDTDFPKYKRELVIKYIEDKYTKERVVHICTFGTLKGSGALTEVLRAHDVFDYPMIKSLTRKMPAQDKVVDGMEEQNEHSLIKYVLRNFPDILQSLGRLEGDVIVGENAYHLEQAIRLEGVIRNVGIHASGILISDDNIENVCPLMLSNDGDKKVSALEMSAAEKTSLVKVDILGTEVCDKIMEISNLLLGISEDQ